MQRRDETTLNDDFRPWLRQLSHRQRRLWLGALLMVSTVAAAIGLLALSGWFITTTAIAGALLAAGVSASVDIYRPGAGIRFFAIARTVSRYVERLYNHDTVLRLLADLRASLFAVLTRLDGRTLGRLRASEWLNRLTADIDTLDSLYLRLLAPPLVALLAIAGIGGLLGILVPGIGLSVGGLLLLVWAWLVVGQAGLGMAASRRRVATLDRLRSRTIEQIEGLAELSCYRTLSVHRRTLHDIEQRLYDDQRRLGRRQALGSALAGAGVSLAALLALWLGAHAYIEGELSGPSMVLMPLAVLAMNEALAVLPGAFTHLGATRASARRLNDLAASRGNLPETSDATVPAPGALEVALQGVILDYSVPGAGNLAPALEEVSFTLHAGQRVALLGASGAGKSSVAQLIVRLIDPSRGQVRVNDRDVRTLALGALRSRVGYLTQHTELFHDSLAANLRLGRSDATDEALWQALELVDLADWARELPRGLETWVGESGRQLSGGQARRVALARVILADTDLVMLDEPFSGVDEATAERIAARLDPWLAGRTVLYLAHDEAHLPGVTRRLWLRDGRLADGRGH
ncbi:ATP-binding cassette, subfamily C, CydC [Modicisalibacter ilicicola DSM 19980]|uniref:ATP-binding cassette, subfamily C, CydC n=1 Tax=Modicisalibacter ilicicola DSM 19980 TaxID=1121942 RepID=A0A1M5CJT9_9GAMM|nr:thiol reductant ABC exporter subunit CydC [Halomonas ilicicola]SHF54956.1 ATP-binding cassette, subfamily C, CydC [Halomonas ilicicola DSM 19980]